MLLQVGQLMQLLLDLLEQDVVLLLLQSQHVTGWQVLQLLQLLHYLLETSVVWLELLLQAPQVLWVALALLVLLLLVLHLHCLNEFDQRVDQLLLLSVLDLLLNERHLLVLELHLGQDLLQLLEQGLELLMLRLVLLNEQLWYDHLLLLLLLTGVVEVLLLVDKDLAALAEHDLELAALLQQTLLDLHADLLWHLLLVTGLNEESGKVLDGLLQSLLVLELLLGLLEDGLNVEVADAVAVCLLLALLVEDLNLLLDQLLLQTLQDGADLLNLHGVLLWHLDLVVVDQLLESAVHGDQGLLLQQALQLASQASQLSQDHLALVLDLLDQLLLLLGAAHLLLELLLDLDLLDLTLSLLDQLDQSLDQLLGLLVLGDLVLVWDLTLNADGLLDQPLQLLDVLLDVLHLLSVQWHGDTGDASDAVDDRHALWLLLQVLWLQELLLQLVDLAVDWGPLWLALAILTQLAESVLHAAQLGEQLLDWHTRDH